MSEPGEPKSSSLDLRPSIHEHPQAKIRLRQLLDISPALKEAAGAIVDVSWVLPLLMGSVKDCNFSSGIHLHDVSSPIQLSRGTGICIYSHSGAVVLLLDMAYCSLSGFDSFLASTEVIVLAIGWVVFLSSYIPVHFLLKRHDKSRKKIERYLVKMICSFFVASWTGVVRYHGPRPSMRLKQVFVANHTSMIDFIVLEQMTPFVAIMQKQKGWVGLLQVTILDSVGCIWFNRSDAKDRKIVIEK
ncbi:Glycerol-3-phosphate acyltransferase 9 [Linum perenne]